MAWPGFRPGAECLGTSIITASRICMWTPLLPVLHPHDPLRTEKRGPGELKGPLGVAPGGTERLCSKPQVPGLCPPHSHIWARNELELTPPPSNGETDSHFQSHAFRLVPSNHHGTWSPAPQPPAPSPWPLSSITSHFRAGGSTGQRWEVWKVKLGKLLGYGGASVSDSSPVPPLLETESLGVAV